MSAELWLLIAFAVYVFIVLLVYFVLCLTGDEDNIGFAVCWPLVLIIGIIYAPFWVVRKSAEYVRRSMEKNEEDDDAE